MNEELYQLARRLTADLANDAKCADGLGMDTIKARLYGYARELSDMTGCEPQSLKEYEAEPHPEHAAMRRVLW